MRAWRRRADGRSYKELKKEYKEVCIRKKQEENLGWERQIEEAKQEAQIWEIVNKERKRRKEMNREIGMEEWKEHFRGLFGGSRRESTDGRGKVRKNHGGEGHRKGRNMERNEEGKG